MIKLQKLKQQEKHLIFQQLNFVKEEADILRFSSVILSKITKLLALAASPYIEDGIFQKLRLIPLAEKKGDAYYLHFRRPGSQPHGRTGN
jgi:transcriptional regulator of heat shock response